jgi:8-oxo-dGTP pyrophosphatase MutT (NUDIX family)
MATMIATDVGDVRFQVRAAAVILDRGRVLLQRAEHEPFWTLPGGRSDAGETAEATVRRELLEETGAEVVVERLLWVVENFFRFQGRPHHEIGWLFAARFADPAHRWMRTEAFDAEDTGVRLLYEWKPVDRLPGIDVHPAFLARALAAVPASPVHVVQRDEREWRRLSP